MLLLVITLPADQAKIIRALIEDNKIKRSKPGRIRVKIERYFSRLQAITSEDAPYYSLKSVRNHIALAHLTLSLVALTALKLGKPDKINSYLSICGLTFFPFLICQRATGLLCLG